MVLSSSDLAQIRADVLDLLPDTGYILSSSSTPDGAGGYTETWGTAGTVTYRLDPLRQREQVIGGAVTPFHSFILTLPYNTTIEPEYIFKASDGQQYNVIGVDDGKSWQASVRCMVERT